VVPADAPERLHGPTPGTRRTAADGAGTGPSFFVPPHASFPKREKERRQFRRRIGGSDWTGHDLRPVRTCLRNWSGRVHSGMAGLTGTPQPDVVVSELEGAMRQPPVDPHLLHGRVVQVPLQRTEPCDRVVDHPRGRHRTQQRRQRRGQRQTVVVDDQLVDRHGTDPSSEAAASQADVNRTLGSPIVMLMPAWTRSPRARDGPLRARPVGRAAWPAAVCWRRDCRAGASLFGCRRAAQSLRRQLRVAHRRTHGPSLHVTALQRRTCLDQRSRANRQPACHER